MKKAEMSISQSVNLVQHSGNKLLIPLFLRHSATKLGLQYDEICGKKCFCFVGAVLQLQFTECANVQRSSV